MAIRILILSALIIFILQFQSDAFDDWHNDSDYSIKIAVTINANENVFGKLEYSNHKPQYPLQLVSFIRMGDRILNEPLVFELIEKIILEPKFHQIKCRALNDKYGGNILLGSIDFRDWTKPKIKLVTESGHTYISNISAKSESLHAKYIPNIYLGN